MFGILKPDARLVAPVERARYSKLYCNLCGNLSESYGVSTRLMTVFDLVTLAWLFGDLEEGPMRFRRLNCLRGGTYLPQNSTRTARDRLMAALSVVMCDIKLTDDIQDGESWRARSMRWAYSKQIQFARQELVVRQV